MKKVVILIFVIMFFGSCGFVGNEEARKERYFKNLLNYIKSEKKKLRDLIFFGKEVKYSPDGKYIAFQIKIKNQQVIYLFDRKKEKVVRGFVGDFDDGCDLFNFDRTGSNLIFMTTYYLDEDGDEQDFFLQIMDIEGKNRKIILRPYQATMHPVFAKDNKTIFFSEFTLAREDEKEKMVDYYIGGHKLHYVRLDEGVDRILFDKFFMVGAGVLDIDGIVPLADGSNIVVDVDKIYLYNIYTSNLIYTGVEYIMNLVYAYNYKDEILYVDYEEDEKGDLKLFVYKLNLKTMKTKKLFLIPEETDCCVESLNLSPDGKKILYVQQIRVTSVANMTNMIWEINIDGTGLRALPVDLSKVEEFPVVNIEEGFEGVEKKKKKKKFLNIF